MPNHQMGTNARRRRKKQLLRAQRGICTVCRRPFTPDDGPTFEHIIPRSEGGTSRLQNLALVHFHCQQQHLAERPHYRKLKRAALKESGLA